MVETAEKFDVYEKKKHRELKTLQNNQEQPTYSVNNAGMDTLRTEVSSLRALRNKFGWRVRRIRIGNTPSGTRGIFETGSKEIIQDASTLLDTQAAIAVCSHELNHLAADCAGCKVYARWKDAYEVLNEMSAARKDNRPEDSYTDKISAARASAGWISQIKEDFGIPETKLISWYESGKYLKINNCLERVGKVRRLNNNF